MEFIKPKFGVHDKPAGVYKITFDDTWFYIGSSTNLKNRIRKWIFSLSTGKDFKSKNIKHILPGISVIKFEVIKIYATTSLIRSSETKHITKHWNNPLFLNRCPNAEKNTGLRPDYLGKIVKEKSPKIDTSKKVAVFNLQDQLIKVCKSYGECSRDFKIDHENIWRILSGVRGQPVKLNCKLKIVNIDGTFSEPPTFLRKNKKNILQYQF